jgi:hypothetical protein
MTDIVGLSGPGPRPALSYSAKMRLPRRRFTPTGRPPPASGGAGRVPRVIGIAR